MKILFAGNSITLHQPKAEIGWFGSWGMAASSPEKDYVHRLCALCEGEKEGLKVDAMIRNITDFERTVGNFDLTSLAALREFEADVIIIRIIENTPHEKLPLFEEAYCELIRYLSKDGRSKVFCTGSFWENKEGERAIIDAAEKTGSIYVPLTSLQEASFRAIGEYENEGVAAHPSDRGMDGIATLLFDAMKKNGAI